MESRVLSAEGWRKIVHFVDEDAGLNALISVHDATLGPGCGGCRIYPYERFEAGLRDVKNLSRGMTFKNALGGIPFGGGKAVIFADPRTDKTPEMLRAFGRAVESLEGLYYTAEDSGVTEADMGIIREQTKYAAGIDKGGKGGNPSPFTARGVWRGMQAAARHQFGEASLKDRTICILGIGAVGFELARLIHEEGGRLIVADVNQAALAAAKTSFDAKIVTPQDAAAADADIFAPCAMGGSINTHTVQNIQAMVIAGAANNQLATPEMDAALRERGILYAPDYVINAAGVISVGLEILGVWSKEEMVRRIDKVGDTLTEIFKRADGETRPTGAVADELAAEVISGGRQAA